MTTQRGTETKQPRSVLAGPYGHPVHPALVALPIGAWVSSIVLDIASLAGDNEALAEASRWLIGIGIISALLAAVFGLLDLSMVPRGTRAFKTGLTHAALNVLAVLLFAVGFWIRVDDETVPALALVLSVVAIVILGASGWLGGRLAYRYGIRVADEQTQAEGFS